MPGPYDYVILGAGSAGCTLAGRLTETPGVRVLLLEAGGWDRHPAIGIPLLWPTLKGGAHDWNHGAEPEEQLGGRSFDCTRGKGIGGSSTINGMTHVRGHRGDYDRWARAGLTEWSYAHALPYFRRQESWEGGADTWRGGDGPLAIRASRFSDPLVDAYRAAAETAGHRRVDDYNGAEQEGFGTPQMTVLNGRRCSPARAYLRPALSRAGLTVETGARVSRIVLEGTRAIGVDYRVRGENRTARVGREIILSCGTINSPQILMLSGIGDPEALRAQGIAVKAALPGIGKNLREHIGIGVAYRRKLPVGTFHGDMRFDRAALGMARAYLFGTGFATDQPSGWLAFLRTEAAAELPDVQLYFRAAAPEASPYLPPFKKPYEDGFTCRAMMLRPESRGVVALTSADPAAPLRIHHNFLDDARDWATLRGGFRLVRDLGRQAPLAPFVKAESQPREELRSDGEIDAHIRANATSVFHGVGTCRMGGAGDDGAVVDQELRVRGIEGLRVVDASVMPDLVGGNINAAVVMIAEKAADLIRDIAPLTAVANTRSP